MKVRPICRTCVNVRHIPSLQQISIHILILWMNKMHYDDMIQFTYVFLFVLFLCYHYILLFYYILFNLISLLYSGCLNKDKPEKIKRSLLDQTKSEQGIQQQKKKKKKHAQNAKCILTTIQSKTRSARYTLYYFM